MFSKIRTLIGCLAFLVTSIGCNGQSKATIEEQVKKSLEEKTGSKIAIVALVEKAAGGMHLGIGETQDERRSILFEALIVKQQVVSISLSDEGPRPVNQADAVASNKAIRARFQQERQRLAEELNRAWSWMFLVPAGLLVAVIVILGAGLCVRMTRNRRRRYYSVLYLTWAYPVFMLITIGSLSALIPGTIELSINRVASLLTGLELLAIGGLLFWTSAWIDTTAAALAIGQNYSTQFRDSYASGFFGFITMAGGLYCISFLFSSQPFPP